MMRWWTKYVIGGRSGKREQAWALVLMWVMGLIFTAWREHAGLPVSGTQDILKALMWPLLLNLGASYGMEWASSQSKWANPSSDIVENADV